MGEEKKYIITKDGNKIPYGEKITKEFQYKNGGMIQSKKADDLKKYNFGGWIEDNKQGVIGGLKIAGGTALLATGVGGPAGVGLIASGTGDIAGEIIKDQNAKDAEALAAGNEQPNIGAPLTKNIAMAEKGGMISKFKGNSHEDGGILLSTDGTGQPTVEVEDKETMSKIKGDKIVHSDAFKINKKMAKQYGLLSSSVGKTPAKYSEQIDNKFIRTNDPYEEKDKKAMIGKLEKLSVDKGRESFMAKYGGKINKMQGGGLMTAQDIMNYFEENDIDYNQEMIERLLSEPKTPQSRLQLANRIIRQQNGPGIVDDLNRADFLMESTENAPKIQPKSLQNSVVDTRSLQTKDVGEFNDFTHFDRSSSNYTGLSNTSVKPKFSDLALPTDIASVAAIGADAAVSFANNKKPNRSDYGFERISDIQAPQVSYRDISARPYLNENQSTYNSLQSQLRDTSGGSASRARAGLLASSLQKSRMDSEDLARIDQFNTGNRLNVDRTNATLGMQALGQNQRTRMFNSQMDNQMNLSYLSDLDTYRQRNADIAARLGQNVMGMGQDYSNRYQSDVANPEYGTFGRYKRKYGGKIRY